MSELEVGQFVGERELLEPIGAGGFCRVFKARDPASGETFAIKVPQVDAFVEHLRKEAGLADRIDDPQVVPILEANLTADPPHLVMPWVEGEPLELPDAPAGPEEIVRALQTVRDLAGVLSRLHERGIVHGDVKPSNLLVDGAGRVRLLDLGLGRVAVETSLDRSLAQSMVSVDGSSIAGTLDYMPPELLEGTEPGFANDLYATGVLLHHLLCGMPPAFGVGPMEKNPYITRRTARVLARLLEADPRKRLLASTTARGDEDDLTVRWDPLLRELDAIIDAERRCLARRNGHERRRVLGRRLAVLRRGAGMLAWTLLLPAIALGIWASGADVAGAVEEQRIFVAFVFFVAVPFGLLTVFLGVSTINEWLRSIAGRAARGGRGEGAA